MPPRLDFASLVRRLTEGNGLAAIARNPRAQFGVPTRRYLGAELLPERTVNTATGYTERGINLLTIIANAGPRYGPVQIKGGAISVSFNVTLGHSDIGRELTSEDLDAIREYLGQGTQVGDLRALETLTNFADLTLNRALIEHNEKNRWDALIDAQNVLKGDNGYEVIVNHLDPDGHRVSAGGDWTDPTYDPIPDLIAGKALLASKGRVPARIITSSEVAATILSNPKVLARTGNATILSDGTFSILQPQATQAAVNNLLVANGLPPIETYDLTYRGQTTSGFFLKRDALLMTARQDNETTIDLGDDENFVLPNALGYTAIGIPAGFGDPGRVIQTEYKRNKPPRIEGEGWQTSAPVVTQPEDVYVIRDITTA